MKIGDKVKILSSLAGKDVSYSDGDEVEVTVQNESLIESLLRSGLAEELGIQPHKSEDEAGDTATSEDSGILPDVEAGKPSRGRSRKARG